jgi:hypothetical protein
LRVIDVGTPSAPVQVGQLGVGDAHGVAVSGNYAYVADRYSGLRVIDISTPSSPVQVGSWATPSRPLKVAVNGNFAYVVSAGSAGDAGLHVIDISTPSSPVQVGYFDQGGIRDVEVSGNYSYVVCGLGLLVIDVSTPSNPVAVGNWDEGSTIERVAVSGNHAFVTGYPGKMWVVDVSTPSSPIQAWESDFFPSVVEGVAVSGDYVYARGYPAGDSPDYSAGLFSFDVSVPSSPVRVGYADGGGGVHMKLSGNYVYGAADWDGLTVCDVNTPTNPVLVGWWLTPDIAINVDVSGNYAYVTANSEGLRVIDVSSPSSPVDVGAWGGGYAYCVAVSGTYAYTTVYVLRVLDISTPSNPVQVGGLSLPGVTEGMDIVGSYAYLANADGLLVLDISTPTNPLVVGYCDTQGHSVDVAVSGDLAYVADWYGPVSGGVAVIDIRNRQSPTEVGYFFLDGVVSVETSNNLIYAGSNSGLWILQYTEPTGVRSDLWQFYE